MPRLPHCLRRILVAVLLAGLLGSPAAWSAGWTDDSARIDPNG